MRDVQVLIVEDDAEMGDTCARLLRRQGLKVSLALSSFEALERIKADLNIRLVLTDLMMLQIDGVQLLEMIKDYDAGIEVVLMTGYGTVQTAVQAMKLGAADYITKPFDKDQLLQVVKGIIESRSLREKVLDLRKKLEENYGFANIIGKSRSIRRVLEQVAAVAPAESPVLVCGESGTGKELVAHTTHGLSRRKEGRFISVDCSAIPKDIFESELFGHKRGAFTGAVQDTPGLFLSAEHGTLLLDEITQMPLPTQAKLLRALQEKRIRPLGSVHEIPFDARLIASSSLEGEEAVKRGRLREDLYYRLGVIVIHLPPLRERREDIPLLVQHFLNQLDAQYHRAQTRIEPAALDLLSFHSWPGNVRELANVLEGIFVLRTPLETITRSDLPAGIRCQVPRDSAIEKAPQVTSLSDAERDVIQRALKASGGNKSKAAEMLGISRTRLYKKIVIYRIPSETLSW